jgi:hypothetical protein
LFAPAEGLGGRLIQAATDGHDALVRRPPAENTKNNTKKKFL